uniref:Uncharacterized protein n=1 Tax=Anguilla anguilla TaxID=7936 RepID=A0A0E9TVP5_ANGAN
MPTATRKRK